MGEVVEEPYFSKHFAVAVIGSVGIIAIGILTGFIFGLNTLTPYETTAMTEQIREIPIEPLGIFSHNAMLMALCMAPFIGAIWAFIVSWSTGVYFAAIALSIPSFPPWYVFRALLFPFAWFEFAAYSLLIGEGTYVCYLILLRRNLLKYRVVHHSWKTPPAYLASLIVAAFLEVLTIQSYLLGIVVGLLVVFLIPILYFLLSTRRREIVTPSSFAGTHGDI